MTLSMHDKPEPNDAFIKRSLLKSKSDQELDRDLKILRQREKKTVLDILYHLLEVDERRRTQDLPQISTEERLEVFSTLEQTSTRDCDRKLASIFPEINPVIEKTKPLSEELTLIQFAADKNLMTRLDKLKGLLGHKNYGGEWAGLFSELANIGLAKLDPEQKQATKITYAA